MKTIQLKLKDETALKIEQYIRYQNSINFISNEDITDYQIEDFISGCVNYYLDKIDAYNHLTSSNGKLKNNLKQLLREKGLNQKQLSIEADIDPGSLSNILSNRSQPSIDYFLKIWNSLGRPPIDQCFQRN